MKSQFLLSCVFLLCMAYCHAQINESDTVKFQLRANLTGNYQKGNVEVLTIKSKIDLSYSPVKYFVIKSQNSSLYQAFYSKEADNDVFSRNYFYYKPQKKIYPFAIGYISTNYRRKIDRRYFIGAGATYQLLNTAKRVIKISVSAVYEQTRLTDVAYNYPAYDGKNKISLWRGTLYAGGWNYFLEKHIRLFYDAYWQPAFNNKDNYRTQVDAGFDLQVWNGLAFNVLYTFTHENVVINKIIQEDNLLTLGLAYSLKIKH